MPTTPRKLFTNCSWETGTLIFATLNLIVLASVIVASFTGYLPLFRHWDPIAFTLLTLICGICASIHLVLAALLFHGVLKKCTQHIKAYLFLGAPMLIVSCFALLILAAFFDDLSPLSPPFPSWYTTSVVVIVLGHAVYALILVMIYKTYRKMEVADKNQDDQRLYLVKNMTEKCFMPSFNNLDKV